MATLLKVLNNLADIKSAGVLHFASELRLSPQRRRGVVLLLAQLARRRIQSPSSVEETVDHGRESRAAAGRLHAREDYATASRAPGDHLHSPVDASAG